jgi:hypothetical protein
MAIVNESLMSVVSSKSSAVELVEIDVMTVGCVQKAAYQKTM